MLRNDQKKRFERVVLPHLDAAYNLARWLMGNSEDAEDVAQESSLRAFRHIDTFRGGDTRSWLLRIVRNTAYTYLQRRKGYAVERALNLEEVAEIPASAPPPEAVVLRNFDAAALRQALNELPPDAREILVLREMEGLAYKEIAEIMEVPIGTVMSRLARARKLLRSRLSGMIDEEQGIEL